MAYGRQVTLEEANAKASQLEIMFMETSAKAGHNVKSLFKKIAMELVGMEKESEVTDVQNTSMSLLKHPVQQLRCLLKKSRAHLLIRFKQKSMSQHHKRTMCQMPPRVAVDVAVLCAYGTGLVFYSCK